MPIYMQMKGIDGDGQPQPSKDSGDADTFDFDQSVTETGNRLYVGNLTMNSSYDSGNTSDGGNAIAIEELIICHEELDRGNVHLHTYWSVEGVQGDGEIGHRHCQSRSGQRDVH